MDHLFRPFSQEDLNIGRNFEGNGLGLALAKRYLEKMGGSLLVDSIKGVGSTFTLTLPLSQKKNDLEKIGNKNLTTPEVINIKHLPLKTILFCLSFITVVINENDMLMF